MQMELVSINNAMAGIMVDKQTQHDDAGDDAQRYGNKMLMAGLFW